MCDPPTQSVLVVRRLTPAQAGCFIWCGSDSCPAWCIPARAGMNRGAPTSRGGGGDASVPRMCGDFGAGPLPDVHLVDPPCCWVPLLRPVRRSIPAVTPCSAFTPCFCSGCPGRKPLRVLCPTEIGCSRTGKSFAYERSCVSGCSARFLIRDLCLCRLVSACFV